jgi:transcriptional antiterminator RfaH
MTAGAALDLSLAAPATRWFAVWTGNGCEDAAAEDLDARGIEVFLPRVRTARRHRARSRTPVRPLFPGYLLVRFAPTPGAYARVASADGVLRILGEGWDAPSAVPDAQVQAVRRIVTVTAEARPALWLALGDPARIVAGPLAGLEGLVQSWRGAQATFVVNVDLVRRGVAVEVATEHLERL